MEGSDAKAWMGCSQQIHLKEHSNDIPSATHDRRHAGA
jgi:hypothetical protein